MTAFLDKIAAVVAHVKTEWGNANGALPIITPNDDASGLNLSQGFVFLRPNITDTDFASINGVNPKARTFGVLEINIHTLINTGIAPGMAYAAQFAGFIRGRMISGVEMYAPTIDSGEEIRYSDYGKFWLTPVTCGFRFDEHLPIG